MRFLGAYLVYRIIRRSGRGKSQTPVEPTYGTKAIGYFLAVVVFGIPAALFSAAGPIFMAVLFALIAFLFLYRAVINLTIVLAIRNSLRK